jgi:hypothetical protein
MSRPHEGAPSDKKSLLPCTPLAIVKLMEHLKVYDEALPIGDRMKGRSVVVINRSEIVGRPLAAMLANDGADVYSVDLNGVYLMRRGKMIEVPPRPEMQGTEDLDHHILRNDLGAMDLEAVAPPARARALPPLAPEARPASPARPPPRPLARARWGRGFLVGPARPTPAPPHPPSQQLLLLPGSSAGGARERGGKAWRGGWGAASARARRRGRRRSWRARRGGVGGGGARGAGAGLTRRGATQAWADNASTG